MNIISTILNSLLPVRLYMGGGGPSETTSKVTQSNLPEYAQPYYERLMDRTEAVSNTPYTQYQGARVAGMNDAQNTAANNIGNMGNPSQFGDATNLTGIAGLGALNSANYQSNQIGSTYNPTAVQAGSIATPAQISNQNVSSNYQPGTFDSAAAAQYMSPYQDAVTQKALDQAQHAYRQQNVARDAQAVGQNAFGGSRAALVQQQASADNNTNQSNIVAQGNQNAYQNAQQQFNTNQQAQLAATNQQMQAGTTNAANNMSAQNANAQYGLQANTANVANNLNAQQFNQGQQQQAGAMNLQAQTANEAARNAAAGTAQKGYALAGDMGNQLSGIGSTEQQAALARNQALMGVGNAQQTNTQAQLDSAYNDFVNQRDYNQNQLNFYSGILHGVPVSPNTDTVTNGPAQGNNLSTLAGLGIAGAGAYGAATK